MYLAYKHVKKKRQAAAAEAAATATAIGQAPTPGAPPREHGALLENTHPSAAAKETPEERAEKKRRRSYRWKIILGLFLPFTLQALDTTIIASAVVFIANDFNQLAQLNWIITAFNLTSAAFLPMCAQLADVLGRHTTLQFGLVTVTIGSALCTAAPNTAFPMLLLGRALQGVGAAGINICVRTILADRVSLGEFAKNWTVFAAVSGISYGVGPVAGGYLTQTSWRWCFGINLPVAVAGIVLVWVLLRKELIGPAPIERVLTGFGPEGGPGIAKPESRLDRLGARLATLDYGGQLLFLWGFGLLVLGFTWAGSTYAWNSVPVLVTLIVGGVLAVAWVVYERSMAPGRFMSRVFPNQKAMMPWGLLTEKDVGLLLFINFANGAGMFAIMYFMDLYFTLVQGHTASQAGLSLLYFLPGMGVGVYTTMLFVNTFPRQTLPILVLGTTCSAVGISMIAYAVHTDYLNLVYGMMALTGFGIGVNTNPSTLHGLAYFPGSTAPITCLASFAYPFGGTITLTIMSTVFNNRSGAMHEDPKSGIFWAYISVVPIMWTAVLITAFLGNVWIGKDGNHEVMHGSYFFHLVTGRKPQKITMRRMEVEAPEGGSEYIALKNAQEGSPFEARRDLEYGRPV
ncbi:major facilitator superfamily domain-containing protein [Dichotomopilus funicola]|uniref:Major facilitator superfamily domain-containing protein n=1 Tax=Dichotomopilus funicola TaxID=1934379 RepID=A0AAN6V295_9PEZI|nr:major facilitator superfamily domain-containing protein [Dichotomopilus funicola]